MRSIFKAFALFAGLALLIVSAGCGAETADSNTANTANAANTNDNTEQAAQEFTDEQIDNLVAPIALYPDPLLAQMLPASTFPEEVNTAASYVRSNGDKGLEEQDWPVSVKSVAHYPDALYYMADNPDWTTSLGQAYALQPVGVMDSIQRLRLRARDAGVLESTPEQEVRFNDGTVAIYPAQPERLYVPRYDPQEVYYERNDGGGGNGLVSKLITFGAGVGTGIWLNHLFDWGDDRVYYHGWRDDDPWVRRTRDHYRWDDDYYRDSYYVDDRWRDIRVNRDVLYRPVRYDRITIYDRIFPRVSYKGRDKEVPGLGDEMRRQDPGRPIEKGPPPGQLKKLDKPGGGPPADRRYDDRDRGRPDDKGGRGRPDNDRGKPDNDRGKPDDKGRGGPPKSAGPEKKGGPPADKGKGRGN